MVPSDDDGASTSLLALLDKIRIAETLLLVGRLQLLSKLVITDTACVDHRVGWQDILRSTVNGETMHDRCMKAYSGSSSSILSGTACDVGDLVVLHNLVIPSQNPSR